MRKLLISVCNFPNYGIHGKNINQYTVLKVGTLLKDECPLVEITRQMQGIDGQA